MQITVKENTDRITGVILAGGRGSRMNNQDKGLVQLNGKPMISYIIRHLQPQVTQLLINANRNLDEYRQFQLDVISDNNSTSFEGPLAGMLSAMQYSNDEFILSVPCDSPFIPADMVQRLLSALNAAGADIAVAHDGVRLQPVFALMKRSLASSLENYLAAGDRKIDLWYAQHKMIKVDCSDIPDTFININTPEEHQRIEQQLGESMAS